MNDKITSEFKYKTLAEADRKIVELQDKLNKQLGINEGLVLENRELKKQVQFLTQRVEELTVTVKSQAEVIEELKRRFGLDSTNSSIPPSKDRLG